MLALEIRGLRYGRPGFSLDLELGLEEGEFAVLLGPSGCGKSTALRVLAGLLEAEAGSILLRGRELVGLPPEKRRVGLVFQDFALFGHLSARKNIEYGPKIAGLDARARRERASELAEALHIAPLMERLPSRLSGGEQQRVALARSLAARPDLLLLDEPLSSLDASLRRELRAEIRERVKGSGLAAIHVTHDIEEALALADRLFLMEGGRILEAGRPEEVYERPRTAFAARLMGRGPLLPVLGMGMQGLEARVETAFGPFRCPPPPGPLAPGQALFLHFAYRAGSLEAAPGGEEGNCLRGRIVEKSYLGSSRRYRLRAHGTDGSGGAEAEFETGPEIELELGRAVGYRLPPAACRLVEA
jgi:ABC-type Fe3+/spermidine/putrescine transport system ATPase subunit